MSVRPSVRVHQPLKEQADGPTFTTFTVFRYESYARLWALQQMGLALNGLNKVPGLLFFKLMGSGRGLVFSLRPDWSRYVLLATWQTEAHAHAFFEESCTMKAFRDKASEIWTIHMYPIQSHGLWSGIHPFQPSTQSLPDNAPVAVLTRASIRPSGLWQFWQNAPIAAKALETASGLIFSCGVGELPLIRQATLSIWENLSVMKSFAYGNPEHTQVMRRKVAQGWYSEELFARFMITGTEGSYQGANPLRNDVFPVENSS